jgi:inner membrane protein
VTSLTHAAMAVAVGSAVLRRRCAPSWLVLGACCAVLPDLDLLAPVLGGSRAFHRTFTHSVVFAIMVGTIGAAGSRRMGRDWWRALGIGLWVAVSTVSHGIADMWTSYPVGVALWSPFSLRRYHLAGQPIKSVTQEFLWVGLPCLVLIVSVLHRRWRTKLSQSPSSDSRFSDDLR